MFPKTLGTFVLLSLAVASEVTGAQVPKGAVKVSSIAGATTTFQFPPAGETDTDNSNYPGTQIVGFAGATPTGNEAEAIQTAPVLAQNQNVFPLIGGTSQQASKKGFNMLRKFGNLSPWYSVVNSERPNDPLPNASPQVPKGCTLEQAHLLHRHGARYPTGGSAPAQLAAAIHALAQADLEVSGPLAFLSNWQYNLGEEILTPFGREQLFNLGVGFRVKYGELLKKGDRLAAGKLPVWRTTSQNRMVESALHFAAGFFGVSSYQSSYHQLITIEQDGFNNTLSPYDNCPNSNKPIGNLGNVQAPKWAAIYTKPAIKRLQPFIKGVTLNATHIVAMQQTCAYETVALGYSAFCELFDENDWNGHEYYNDLVFYYSNGPGNPTVPSQGIGYVQELLSRLNNTPITNFDTSVNQTIVSNRDLFPLGNDQGIYVDASHDTILTAIFVAMNFTSVFGTALPTDHIPAKQQWVVNELAPFASNMVGQVMTCPTKQGPTKQIRFIINDRVVPLTGLAHCQTPNKDGLCNLDNFIKGLEQRVQEVDYQQGCFGNLTMPKL